MDVTNELGLIGILLVTLVGLASMCFAAMQIWQYLDRSPRWGRSAANVVTGLAVIPLLWGGWLLFDIIWIARRFLTLARRRHGGFGPANGAS